LQGNTVYGVSTSLGVKSEGVMSFPKTVWSGSGAKTSRDVNQVWRLAKVGMPAKR